MMNFTSVFTSILVLFGSCLNVTSLSLDIGDVEFEQVTVNTGESVTLACQAGISTIDDVYWLSIRYRRFISRNDVLFDYGTELDNFDISVDDVNRIYSLHVYEASENVSGVYMCYSSTTDLDKQVLWAGELIVLAGYDFSSSLDTSVSEKSNKPNPPHSLECSASYIPPMMNLINVDEVEMEVRCSWSAFDHPDASPTLFCNGKELLSKYFVGEMVTARVMLKDVMECFNFTCALMGAIGEDPFKETSCSYMQEIQSGLLAPVRREGVRVDPMYSVIQQGMDAMFVCIASLEAPGGTFQWNVSSRLFDPEELISRMEITQSTKASTLLIKDIQVLTDESVLVRCQLITDDQRKKVMMSESLLTVMTQMSDYSNKTSDPVLDKTFGMTTVLTLVVLVLVLFAIIFCFAIYLKFCRSKNGSNAVARPTENANNNENRKMYVSMKGIRNRNITRRAKHPVPTQRAADNPDIILESCPIPPGRHPAQRKDPLQESLSINRIDVSSLRSNPVICIDDSNYIVPDGAEGGGGGGCSPIVLRARNPRHPEAHYSSTDVMVGSREMMSARSSQEGLEDRDGYLVPSIVVDQDLEEYVYATSEGTNGKPGTHRKSSSCHDLSNYYSACYE